MVVLEFLYKGLTIQLFGWLVLMNFKVPPNHKIVLSGRILPHGDVASLEKHTAVQLSWMFNDKMFIQFKHTNEVV
jgi:hypothetical protein